VCRQGNLRVKLKTLAYVTQQRQKDSGLLDFWLWPKEYLAVNKKARTNRTLLTLGWLKGIEPSTYGSTTRCSTIELQPPSICTMLPESVEFFNGALGGNRTPNQLLRRELLYPLSYEGQDSRLIQL
ncbi:MAG: hypothetical protein CEO22_699, partial [Candidatus Berkelbacteria bacterium Gr01-1014_85]